MRTYRCRGSMTGRGSFHRQATRNAARQVLATSGSCTFSSRPACFTSRALTGSPGSRARMHARVSDLAESSGRLRFRAHRCCLPQLRNCVGTLIFRTFRGSMAGLHVPLSTLHMQPCDCPRMTRSQVGSLLLTCATLTFATPRQFIPAHSRMFSRLATAREMAASTS
jgi:hypothetical protein